MSKVLNKYKNIIPEDAVYIGRPSFWGNPFVLDKDGDREEIIEKYTTWLLSRPDIISKAKKELKGKYLICFCAPLMCHGHVLEYFANEEC